MSVKYSHDVIFNEDTFPGHTFFNTLLPVSHGFSPSTNLHPTRDSSPNEHIIASPLPTENVGSPPMPASSLSPSEHLIELSPTTAVRPGWDIVVQPINQNTQQDISSFVSSDKIVLHKRH
ncbi:hypothetical protein O181_074013 [Austropuccinia psidii MF-1]|uniref:Uncharacterized protein n=1 Tax=Austropuccinia psidii MF-1 TaxID=1389203 RepID=A0A9Q3FA85_9BASI|nr:hypothetical protein [Austropuccinia psidii MF-1]